MKNICLIFTASDPWEIWHRRVFVLEIARQIKNYGGIVLCLEPPIFSLYTLIKYPERIVQWAKRKYKFRQVHSNIWAVAPFTFEHILLSVRFKPLLKLNRFLISFQLSRYLKKMSYSGKSIAFLLHRPELGFLKGVLNINKVIYDCWDEFTVTFDNNKVKVEGNVEREASFAKTCDLIITNSTKLNDKLIKYNPNTYEIVCAFTESVFKNSKIKAIELLEGLNKPIIGYIGNVRNWIDFGLIEYILKVKPDWNILFVGSIKSESKKTIENLLKKYDNFNCTGTVSYDDFPSYLRYFEVGIIPFLNNEFINNTNPNKFYEYLASGIPVVSVPIDHLERHFSDVSKIAVNKEDFLKKIEYLINMNEKEKMLLKEHMKFVAAENTWEKRTQFFVNLLQKYIFPEIPN